MKVPGEGSRLAQLGTRVEAMQELRVKDDSIQFCAAIAHAVPGHESNGPVYAEGHDLPRLAGPDEDELRGASEEGSPKGTRDYAHAEGRDWWPPLISSDGGDPPRVSFRQPLGRPLVRPRDERGSTPNKAASAAGKALRREPGTAVALLFVASAVVDHAEESWIRCGNCSRPTSGRR
jgi:hypothetical protein